MPQTTTESPTTSTTDPYQKVTGPDGKPYRFSKGLSQDRMDKYFTKQGWIKKDGEWYTKNGEKASDLRKTPNAAQVTDYSKTKAGDTLIKHGKMGNAALDYGSNSLSSVGGVVGGLLTKSTQGATAGAVVGEVGNQLIRRYLLDPQEDKQPIPVKQAGVEVIKAATFQAALHWSGEKAGALLFKVLSKIPHAKLIEGIPLLHSETKEGGAISRYVEGTLSKLIPGANEFEKFRLGQRGAIDAKLEELVNGLSKFKGTSADMGNLVQKAVTDSEKMAKAQIEKIIIQKNIKTNADLYKTAAYQAWDKEFNNSLIRTITKTESPSLIAGYVRNQTTGSMENIHKLVGILGEKPAVLAKAQNRIMRDLISEAMQGSKDPVNKTAIKTAFPAQQFQTKINDFGAPRFKALFGQEVFDNVEHFISLTSKVGTSANAGSGFGNLALLLPFRSGISLKAGGKLGLTSLVINRMAKIVTSTEGMKLYEGEIRATTMGAIKAANIAREGIKKFNERSDQQMIIDMEKGVEEGTEKNKSLPYQDNKK